MSIKSFMESVRSWRLCSVARIRVQSTVSAGLGRPVYPCLRPHLYYRPKYEDLNATARRGQQGPYMEIRKEPIWLQKLGTSQIQLTREFLIPPPHGSDAAFHTADSRASRNC
jgi:hypothetical protein